MAACAVPEYGARARRTTAPQIPKRSHGADGVIMIGLRSAPLHVIARMAVVIWALAGCAAPVPLVQRVSHYPGALERPLAERVIGADRAVIDRAHRSNLEYGQDVRPRPAAPGHPLIPVVKRVLSRLPAQVAALAQRHLVAVYALEEDYGTATTEAVQDRQGTWRYAYIVLNLTALGRTANAWATWKERSAFRPGDDPTLNVVIADNAQDNVAGAIRFILLHELGHVLGLGLRVHEYWEEGAAASRSFPYTRFSWRLDPDGAMVSRWRQRFPRLHKTRFYLFAQAPLAISEAPAVYRALAQTGFPSLYGTTNLFDDFAEAFAIYVHTILLGNPYRVEIRGRGQVRVRYRSCIQTGACPGKFAQIEALLAHESPEVARAASGARVASPALRPRVPPR